MEMTANERDAWESSFVNEDGESTGSFVGIRARLVAKCAVDESGKPLFTPKQVHKLGQASGTIVDKLFAACQELNGYTEEDLEELEGNSGDGQNGDSGSS
jgi:hypothetical protein